MRILIASSIHPEALRRLERSHEVTRAFDAPAAELLTLIQDQDALVFRSGVTISKEILAAARRLRLVIRAGSGLDNLDLAELERRGIELRRIPRPSAQAVAELTFALMLALARNVLRLDQLFRHGCWAKNHFESHLLHGKTLGIVGVGNIGRRVGQMGAVWGMEVVGCTRPSSPLRVAELRREGIELCCFDEVVSRADFLSVHAPLEDSTRHLIDADVVARMKPGAFLVNTARGGVVDEEALYPALRSGRLRGAGLDVHTLEGPGRLSPLRELPNVVLTPHVGSSTVDTQREIGREIVALVESVATLPGSEEVRAVG
jgi:D-3-phosphoglycerate dehydrogenase